MKWYQKKWVKWPLRIFGGFFALIFISAILNPSEGPSSITLSDIPAEALVYQESATLHLETTPDNTSFSALSLVYDDSLLNVEKGNSDNEIIVTARDTSGTTALCVKSRNGSALSNIALLEVKDPDADAQAEIALQEQINQAVAQALADKESEISDLQSQLEEAQSSLAETQLELQQTTENLNQTKEQLSQSQSELTQTQNKLKKAQTSSSQTSSASSSSSVSSGSSRSADSGITNSQTVLITRTGSKYHNQKCGNGTYYETTLNDALSRGLGPCKKCY